MAGALIHLGIALFSALIVHLRHMKFEFSIMIFIGNLLPDVIKFGFSAIKQLTWNVFGIEQDAFYHSLSYWTSNLGNWFSLGFFVFALMLFLYHFHYVKKKTMEEYDELYIFLLIGIITHIILDLIIIEQGIWF